MRKINADVRAGIATAEELTSTQAETSGTNAAASDIMKQVTGILGASTTGTVTTIPALTTPVPAAAGATPMTNANAAAVISSGIVSGNAGGNPLNNTTAIANVQGAT
jgi:hypothetical protein